MVIRPIGERVLVKPVKVEEKQQVELFFQEQEIKRDQM